MEFTKDLDKANIKDFGNLNDRAIWLNSDLIPEVKQMNDTVRTSGIWVEKEGKIYYFKTVDTFYSLFAEFIGEKISRFFDLSTVHYELAKGTERNGKRIYGLVSEYMRLQDHKYQTWEKYLEEKEFYKTQSVNDLAILHFFEKDFINEPIVDQTKAFFIRELLTNEDDRLINELLIEEKDNFHSLGYLLDYAREFRLPHKYFLFVPFCYRFSLRDPDMLQKIQEDDVFQMYIEKALCLEMKKLLKEVQEEQALFVPEELAESFENFFSKSQSILKMYLKR